MDALQDGRDLARVRIELDDAAGVIRDENAAVPMDLEAVGLPVVVGDQREAALFVDPEHPAPGHVHAIQTPLGIEGRPLQQGMRRLVARLVAMPLGRASGFLKASGRRAKTWASMAGGAAYMVSPWQLLIHGWRRS